MLNYVFKLSYTKLNTFQIILNISSSV